MPEVQQPVRSWRGAVAPPQRESVRVHSRAEEQVAAAGDEPAPEERRVGTRRQVAHEPRAGRRAVRPPQLAAVAGSLARNITSAPRWVGEPRTPPVSTTGPFRMSRTNVCAGSAAAAVMTRAARARLAIVGCLTWIPGRTRVKHVERPAECSTVRVAATSSGLGYGPFRRGRTVDVALAALGVRGPEASVDGSRRSRALARQCAERASVVLAAGHPAGSKPSNMLPRRRELAGAAGGCSSSS